MKKKTELHANMHARNIHRDAYDFGKLVTDSPDLKPFLTKNKNGLTTVDFAKPESVLQLNKALLKTYYDIDFWQIPEGYLCPPVPGRADYIHHAADLLRVTNKGKVPKGETIKCLDIGVGATCIYPILGRKLYKWSFIGTDIDTLSLKNSGEIIEKNDLLKGHVELKVQKDPRFYFKDVVGKEELIDLTICNPPFHASKEEADAATQRKLKNLKGGYSQKPVLNFGGTDCELWCPGGERRFVADMITQSRAYGKNILWFSALISKEKNLDALKHVLKRIEVQDSYIIPMQHGNKKSRILTWSFYDKKYQKYWMDRKNVTE